MNTVGTSTASSAFFGGTARLSSQFPLLLRGFLRYRLFSSTTTTTVTTQSSSVSSKTKSKSTKPTSTSLSSSSSSFRWLDLEGSRLSMVERLSVEEALLRKTNDNWIIVGRHAVWPNKHITIVGDDDDDNDNDDDDGLLDEDEDKVENEKKKQKKMLKILPEYITRCIDDESDSHIDDNCTNKKDVGNGETANDDDGNRPNPSCQPNPTKMIVMGIGGKAHKLLHCDHVRNDQLLVVKRFSGGGTVVMDKNAIWTTIIAGRQRQGGKRNRTPNIYNDSDPDKVLCKPYPRSIMEWTANTVFGPTFEIMNNTKTKKILENENKRQLLRDNGDHVEQQLLLLPKFSFREDDYVLNETHKIGGNAQAISGSRWLHHTSFLWDYDETNMERYLQLPSKRPDYRRNRTHQDFLVKLKDYYGTSSSSVGLDSSDDNHNDDDGHRIFIESMKEACEEAFSEEGGGVVETDWTTVYREVFGNDDNDNNNDNDDAGMTTRPAIISGGIDSWWLENRTRIVHELDEPIK